MSPETSVFTTLKNAQSVFEASGRVAVPPVPDAWTFPIVESGRVSFAPGPAPDQACVIIRCGEVTIGFAIADADLQAIAKQISDQNGPWTAHKRDMRKILG